MAQGTRREFLADVGKGMLFAGLGAGTIGELGLSPLLAEGKPEALRFGKLEPLVVLMQDTPVDKLLPVLLAKMKEGTDLKTLVTAGALANTRTFGGLDYTGYHTLMALAPAYDMSKEMPEAERALPVLKVLYRNTGRMQEKGGCAHETLHALEHAEVPKEKATGEALRDAARKADMTESERLFAATARRSPDDAFNMMQEVVHDDTDVHRVVLAWRAWALLDFTGKEQAHTMLRQSVRYCASTERNLIDQKRGLPGVRKALPKLIDQYKLATKTLGDRKAEDGWIDKLATSICLGSRDQAAEVVAAALAEGFATEAIGEALALAANQLVLRDPGRTNGNAAKPNGSVHGDSVGVHASDAANAWRNIARVVDSRNAIASLIVGAYHTGGQAGMLNKQPQPLAEDLEKITLKDADALLKATTEAVKAKEQARACALAHRYEELGHPSRAMFDLLLGFACSEDGALHAEKYYRTVCEEYAAARPAFRRRHLAALARVTASEYGYPAPGYAEARRLLKM